MYLNKTTWYEEAAGAKVQMEDIELITSDGEILQLAVESYYDDGTTPSYVYGHDEITEEEIEVDVRYYVDQEFIELMDSGALESLSLSALEKISKDPKSWGKIKEDFESNDEEDEYLVSEEYFFESIVNGQRKQANRIYMEGNHSYESLCNSEFKNGVSNDEILSIISSGDTLRISTSDIFERKEK